MTIQTATRTRSYSIKEAAALTGLPATTLRYYEQVGVIDPVRRGASSGHRVYDEDDLDQQLLLDQQQRHLAVEAERLVLRQRYVDLKIAYWRAVQDGAADRSDQIAGRARELADELRAVTHRP